LGIKFDLNTPPELQIYRPDGEVFLSFEQVSQRLATTTRELENISQTLSTTERELATQNERNQLLAAKLRELGIDPDLI
jgi:regulator of replication initiation timing